MPVASLHASLDELMPVGSACFTGGIDDCSLSAYFTGGIDDSASACLTEGIDASRLCMFHRRN